MLGRCHENVRSMHSVTFLLYFILFAVASLVPRTVAGPKQGLSKHLLNVLLCQFPLTKCGLTGLMISYNITRHSYNSGVRCSSPCGFEVIQVAVM